MVNCLKMKRRQQVIALLELGWTYRRIEAETGVRRETVSRYDRQRASLGTYLCAAARNLSLRQASRAWRERSVAALPELRPAPGPSPLDTLLEDERASVVREALSVLAPLHREVLILAEYEDLDLARIAQIVGAEVGAVKVRLHRARKKLRAALEAHARSAAVAAE